jgi:hypothetical protein
MSMSKRFLPVVLGVSSLAGCSDSAKKTDDVASSSAKSGGSAKASSSVTSPNTQPSVLKRTDPIPERLGGAAMPVPRPQPSLSVAPPAPAPARANGAAAAEAAAPGAAAAPAPAAPAAVTELALVHNHPKDQPCQPLSEAEIKRAFGDL